MRDSDRAKLVMGNLVRVEWVDICGGVNESADNTNIIKCVSLGVVWFVGKRQIKLCTSLFEGMGDHGDFTAIPWGVIESVRIIRKGYKLLEA